MARRRLTPPNPLAADPPPPPSAKAPIAHVAGEAAASAALREVAGALEAARAEGRLMLRLDLGAVDPHWLMRDRVAGADDEMEGLMASLRAHGQRQPVEVAALGPERYGLISGWRRLTALRRLRDETGDPAFATVLAILRRPESDSDAYVAMVEENEIRLGLSYYERARIVVKSVEAGVFATEKAALQQLFAHASRARRSKIGSFVRICRALDGVLRFPAALPERLGLALAQGLAGDAALAGRLGLIWEQDPPEDAAAEQAALARALARRPPSPPTGDSPCPGVVLRHDRGRITLTGPGVTEGLRDRLRDWLRAQG